MTKKGGVGGAAWHREISDKIARQEKAMNWPQYKNCTCKGKITESVMFGCPEHGGWWSYKCGACVEHSRKLAKQPCGPGWGGIPEEEVRAMRDMWSPEEAE